MQRQIALRSLIASAAVFVSLGATAQEATQDHWLNPNTQPAAAVSVQAPAAVPAVATAAAPVAAKQAVKAPAAGKTRAEVKAELAEARRSGELARLQAEAFDFGSYNVHLAQPVLAEAKTPR